MQALSISGSGRPPVCCTSPRHSGDQTTTFIGLDAVADCFPFCESAIGRRLALNRRRLADDQPQSLAGRRSAEVRVYRRPAVFFLFLTTAQAGACQCATSPAVLPHPKAPTPVPCPGLSPLTRHHWGAAPAPPTQPPWTPPPFKKLDQIFFRALGGSKFLLRLWRQTLYTNDLFGASKNSAPPWGGGHSAAVRLRPGDPGHRWGP